MRDALLRVAGWQGMYLLSSKKGTRVYFTPLSNVVARVAGVMPRGANGSSQYK